MGMAHWPGSSLGVKTIEARAKIIWGISFVKIA
jgi:hypothetical protein